MRLYGTDACADCLLAKKILEKYGVAYDWVDVSKSSGFEGEVPQLEIDDVPSTSIDNKQIIVGYNNIAKYLRLGHV